MIELLLLHMLSHVNVHHAALVVGPRVFCIQLQSLFDCGSIEKRELRQKMEESKIRKRKSNMKGGRLILMKVQWMNAYQ